MKKTVLIITAAVLIAVTGALISMKMKADRLAEKMEQFLNNYCMNAEDLIIKEEFKPFKCSGLNNIVCKSENISFDLYGGYSVRDIVIIAYGNKKNADADIKGKIYMGKEFNSSFNYKINASIEPSSQTARIFMNYVSDSAYNNANTNNSLNIHLKHPFFAKGDIMQVKSAWEAAKENETEFRNQVGMIGFRIDDAEFDIKSDNLYDTTLRNFAYYGMDMDPEVYARELANMKNDLESNSDENSEGYSIMKDAASLLGVLEGAINGKYNVIKVHVYTKDEYADEFIRLDDINMFNVINYLNRFKMDSQGFEK